MNGTVGRKRKGQIREIAPGKYYIAIQRGTGANRSTFSETFDGTIDEARDYLKLCLDKLNLLERHPERAKTVSMLVDEYLTRRASLTSKPKTLLNYRDVVRRYVAPNIGNLMIGEVRVVQIKEFYDNLRLGEYILGYKDKGILKHKKAETKLSAHVVNKIHTVLQPAFTYAVEREYLAANPLLAVKAHKVKKTKFIIPTQAECDKLFAFCAGAEEKALFMCAYYTGARPEEYLAAEWSDVDLKTKEWKIARAIVEMPGGKQNWRVEDLKTEKSQRTQPLVPDLIEALKEVRVIQLERRLKLGGLWTDKNLVFGTYDGDYRQNTNVGRQFKALLKRAGLSEKIRLYDLRHAYATHLLEAGATVKDIADMLGHSSIRVASDTYIHVSQERKRSIAGLLERRA